MKKLACLSLVLLSLNVFADNCERPRNAFDSLYCARKVFFQLDDALNDKYKELRGLINDDQKNMLKSSQIGWIKQRDSKCTVNNRSIIVSCAVKRTRERLTFLENRIFECKGHGCIDNHIKKINE